jgi:hypothetical protein
LKYYKKDLIIDLLADYSLIFLGLILVQGRMILNLLNKFTVLDLLDRYNLTLLECTAIPFTCFKISGNLLSFQIFLLGKCLQKTGTKTGPRINLFTFLIFIHLL